MDWLEILLVCFALGIGILIGCFIVEEIIWYRTPIIECKAELLKSSHQGSTLRTTTIPVVGSNGQVGIGMATTGHDEEFTTIWNAGKYGRLVVDDKIVFQYGKEKSILLIKVRGINVRVVGIVR